MVFSEVSDFFFHRFFLRSYFSNRSNALVQLKRYEEALADANRTVELDPKFVRGYGRKGNALFFLARYDEAADAYEAGLKLEPKNEGYMQELQRCRSFQSAAPFLRPDWAAVLAQSPMTNALLGDPKFVEKIQAIRANPMILPMSMSDKEVEAAFIVLSGLETKMREQQKAEEKRQLDEKLRRREEAKKKEQEAEEKKKKAAFEALPKNKQDALLAKDAGNAFYKASKFQEALEKYDEAIKHDPTDALLLNNKAAALMGLKDYAKAAEVCEAALEVTKEHAASFDTLGKVYARYGKALAKLKRWREALDAYDQSLVNVRDPQTVKFRNQVEEKMKQAEADAYKDPVKAEEAKNKGNEFFKQENWGDAIRAYSDAILRNPDLPVYYSNRAISYIKVREYQLALRDAEKCLELDPSFIKGWVRKGMAHHFLKEYYKAMEAYDKGMKIDPNYPELIEWAEKSTQALQRMRSGGGEGSKEDLEEARKRALADPKIQAVLKDGEIQNLMATLQAGNQKAAQEMLSKSATLFEKYQTLAKAGLM